MALKIKNKAVEGLVTEVSRMTGETKVETIRKALIERKAHLEAELQRPKRDRVLDFLENRVWPSIPKELLGKPVSQSELDEILGYGPKGAG